MNDVITRNNKKYQYDRRAYEDDTGGVPLSQMRDDEIVIAPGLIYREVYARRNTI